MTRPALDVRGLGVMAGAGAEARTLLRDVSFTLAPGSSVGLVGPSGAGKSTIGRALLRLLPPPLRLAPSSAAFLGSDDLFALGDPAMRDARGRRLSLVPQEPLLALDPAMPVGGQLAECLVVHAVATGREAHERAVAMLARVGIADAASAARRYPHEFSGGMRQRVVLAMALILGPAVVIADEPTTALDPTLQAQVLDLLDALRAESGTALLLISHDLDLVGERCERVLALEGGRLVADGPAAEIVRSRRARRFTPVTRAAEVGTRAPLLEVRGLSVRFPGGPRGEVRAVEDLSLAIAPGESLGIVGESGCGKSTLAGALLRLVPLTAGSIRFDGSDVSAMDHAGLRRLRGRARLVPQEAGASLTPHLTAGALVAEGLEVHGIARGADARARARALLDEMELPARTADARPSELSTGERQRVAIARALATAPTLLICDEPVSAVDAVVREQLLALLDRLRRDRGLALLFISHDLGAVARIASRIAVMYLGRIVESARAAELLDAPRMPYTRALLSAVPTGDPAGRARRIVLAGEPPSAVTPPDGCPFHPRCPHPLKDARCAAERPPLSPRSPTHDVACWHG